MNRQNILIIGGGIGGLTAAIALGKRGHRLTVVEKDPNWSVYGVGIIQQANVIRAMADLGIVEDYVEAGFGFDLGGAVAEKMAFNRVRPDHKLEARQGVGGKAY